MAAAAATAAADEGPELSEEARTRITALENRLIRLQRVTSSSAANGQPSAALPSLAQRLVLEVRCGLLVGL